MCVVLLKNCRFLIFLPLCDYPHPGSYWDAETQIPLPPDVVDSLSSPFYIGEHYRTVAPGNRNTDLKSNVYI